MSRVKFTKKTIETSSYFSIEIMNLVTSSILVVNAQMTLLGNLWLHAVEQTDAFNVKKAFPE